MERRTSAALGALRAAALVLVLAAAAGPLWSEEVSPEGARGMARLLAGSRGALAPLAWDAELAAVAGRYAAELLARGELSHEGEGGDRAVDRLRRAGLTDARVGEVLGAGADAGAVVGAWLASAPHRAVLLGAAWTHIGAGEAASETTRVWVVLVVERAVEALSLRGGRELCGRLTAPVDRAPFLLVGLERRDPERWEPSTGSFCFAFEKRWLAETYVRLCVLNGAGETVVANVLHAASRLPED